MSDTNPQGCCFMQALSEWKVAAEEHSRAYLVYQRAWSDAYLRAADSFKTATPVKAFADLESIDENAASRLAYIEMQYRYHIMMNLRGPAYPWVVDRTYDTDPHGEAGLP